jgi:hypothetical protein
MAEQNQQLNHQNNNAPGADKEWQRPYGDPMLNTEFSIEPMAYNHEIKENKNFAESHVKQEEQVANLAQAAMPADDGNRWRLLAMKVFSEGTLKDANVVGADVSDFKVKVGDPSSPEWVALQGYIYDREEVEAGHAKGKPLETVMVEDATNKTIDLAMLLLKGNDQQIKAVMSGAFYTDATVFHADREYDNLIKARLGGLSNLVDEKELVDAKYDYQDLRQESVGIFDNIKGDGHDAGSPYTKLVGTHMGDAKTIIPALSGVVAEPLEKVNRNVQPEAREKEKAFQSLHGLIARNEALDALEEVTHHSSEADRNKALEQLVGDKGATYAERDEYKTKLTVTAKVVSELYPSSKVSDEWIEKHYPPDPVELYTPQEVRDNRVKVRTDITAAKQEPSRYGVPVSSSNKMLGQSVTLEITGVMFDCVQGVTDAKGQGAAGPKGDYLVGRDVEGNKYLIGLNSDAIEEVGVVVGDKVGKQEGEMGAFLMRWFRTQGICYNPEKSQINKVEKS